MLEYFKEDIRRYFTPGEAKAGISAWKMIMKVLRNEPLWAVLSYRFGRWVSFRFSIPVLRTIIKIVYALLARPLAILLTVSIDLRADIGKGFYLGHVGSVWIGPVKMGEYCNISQEVTIGIGGHGEFRGVPELGNRVYIGPGAKLFGKIAIGNNVAIGANAVVSKNIPDNAIVVGNPGRIVSYDGSHGLIELIDENL